MLNGWRSGFLCDLPQFCPLNRRLSCRPQNCSRLLSRRRGGRGLGRRRHHLGSRHLRRFLLGRSS